MAIDLREGQFLAQLVALPAVAGEVDRLRVEEGFVEPVELLLDRFCAALLVRRPRVRFGTPLLPDVKDAILHQAHVAGRRLQKRQFVNERAFEHGFADIDGAALPLTVVVRVVVLPAFRPASREGTSTRFAVDETTQWAFLSPFIPQQYRNSEPRALLRQCWDA